ncbi:endonuclease III domain-containing protein [Aquicella lusitana]|uniref:DNA-3-methyladenine glycosylase III n=1 Tax=Aquicella lusitana TaxID=254246 RepID=A0A370GY62_9COXI|nr:endonuclease III domain-containing protein [Aquicella lusitana]RDI48592.1 DNA-3-methyladenine glycosylase III [Aquicella lusitana]VVC74031.1 Endonuclease III [Aquicella lusitana]
MSPFLHRKLNTLYKQLRETYGPQSWWPAENRFEIMVGAILTQNTNWTNVEKAIHQLKQNNCLSPEAIHALPEARLAGYIKSSGYYNQKARRLKLFCQWYLEQGGYKKLKRHATPALRQMLLDLHGIGNETADDILLYAFDRPVFVIDAYTHRLLQRTGLTGKLNYEEAQIHFHQALPPDEKLFSEYHALIVQHAKHACRKVPLCGQCSLKRTCAHYRENAASR